MESNLVQNLVNLKSLPETWAVKDFKEVVSDNSGGNKKLAKSNFLKEGDIAVVDQGKKLIAGFYNDTSLAVKTQPPYVVFGDHTRVFKYIDFPFIMGADGTKVLQPKKDNCETKYLYYFFLSINVPNTGYNRHFKYLKNLKIPLPPLEQQKKIAAILDEADAYRQKTKALIEKYDELTQSLFLDMFGDPVTNPMEWECKKFENFTTKYNQGVNTTTEKIKYEDDGTFPIIRAGEVGKGSLSFDSVVWVDHENESRIKETCKPIKGDVLYANIGANLGTACLVETNRAFGIAWNVFRIQLKEQVNRTFFVHQLNSEWVKRVVWSKVKTATVPFISGKQIAELNFINPPVYIQSDFEKRVQAIEAQKAQTQASLAQAEDLFNSLLQRAFKGELTS